MIGIERIRQVAKETSREEVGDWLGMAVRRKHPRRVLAALRTRLTV